MKLNLFTTFLTTATLVTALGLNFTQQQVGATEQKTPDVTLPSVKSRNEKKGLTKSSQRLIGTWSTSIFNSGNLVQIVWQIQPDGTYSSIVSHNDQKTHFNGSWKYSNGVIYENADGKYGKSSITWISEHEFVLTVIDNSDPAYKGLQLRFFRTDSAGQNSASQRLVGKWSRLRLMNAMYTFTFNPDGTFTMLKQVLFIGLGASEEYHSGVWQYSNGTLLLKTSQGEIVKGTISWISQNEFVYTDSSGSSKKYSRVFD